MSLVPLLLAAEAAQQDRAMRCTAYRHRFLANRSLVITAYNLSGEAAAPLGFCYGTDPRRPMIVTAAEPRNRDSRFGAINQFAADFVRYIAPFLELEEAQGRHGTYKRALDAPQLVFPNQATRDYICTRLGRSLRYLGLGATYPVPEETQWAGAHLSYLAEHARMPGQSVVLAATEVMNRHFITGQSDLENENLASLLAWITNPVGAGRAAIDAAEDSAFGPVPDPAWERRLEPWVKQWSRSGDDAAARKKAESEVEERVRDQLVPAYEATFQALTIMRAIPEAASVADRWSGDVRLWSGHAKRAEKSIPRFARRHDAIRAARLLEQWSKALEALEFEEALDDPLVMAEHDADGRCIFGHVEAVDLEHTEVKPGRQRATQVPLVTLFLEGSTRLLAGDFVLWTDDQRVSGEIRAIDGKRATVAVLDGHKYGTRVPKKKTNAMFASLSVFGGKSPEEPDDVPWTHRATGNNADEPGPREAKVIVHEDGAPDMSSEELIELPLVGDRPLDETPEVLI